MPLNVTGGALEFDAVIKDGQFDAAIKRMEANLQGLTGTAQKEADAIGNLVKRAAAGIASYAAFIGGTNFVGDIVRVRGEFQQLEVAFTTMLGSKAEADKLLAEVTEFAATTPFELSDVAKATKQLLAFGISADKIKDTLRSLGDVSAGIGAPLGEIAYLFGTIKTQGVALTQDVRQFAQRGIPVYEELAKVLGVTTEQVGDFITAGKVGFPEIEKVFQNLTAEGSKFGGLMAEQAKTLGGQISNLRDAWDQMLNTIGKGQEGLFSDIISGATFAVQNFDKVVDVLKVLVITYGSYKAAVIATTAVQAIQTAATKGYTIAEILRYRAMLLSETAMKLLNKTMLSNPYVAVAAGLAAVVSALVIFGKTASAVKSKADLLADANEKFSDRLAEAEARIRPYVEALKKANLTEQERLEIYNKLKAIDPEIVKGIDAKSISYQNVTANLNLYLAALRKQIALEANKDALQSSIKEEQSIQKRLDKARKDLADAKTGIEKLKEAGGFATQGIEGFIRVQDRAAADIENLTKSLAGQQKVTEELGEVQRKEEAGKQGDKKRTLKIIDEEIAAERKKQSEFSATSKEFQDFQKKINALEAERRSITGATNRELKAQATLENGINALLEKRKDLIQQIDDLKKNATTPDKSPEQLELDKINQKYDTLIENISDYNKKVDEFNKNNPKTPVSKIGQFDITALNTARSKELTNTSLKFDAEQFKANLDKKKELFEKFEESIKTVGIEKARELYAGEIKEFGTFRDLLDAEAKKLAPKIAFGIANVGEVEKFKAILAAKKLLDEKNAEEQLRIQQENFIKLLDATVTFKDQELAINKKYDDLEATLDKDSTLSNKEDRRKILQDGRREELESLKNDLVRQSALYKKLNQDIIAFTRQRLKEEIRILKEKLKTDATLSPQVKADIQGVIDQYEGLLQGTNETAKDFNKIASALSQVSGTFSELASALEGVNDGLADTLSTMGEIIGIGANAAGAIASFASGDILGGIDKTIKVITGIINIGKKARESERKAREEIAAFQQQVLAGEIETTQQIRQQQREAVKLNKIKITGLLDEKKLLLEQKRIVEAQAKTILQQLQAQSFVADTITEKFGGFLGIGRKTKTTEVLGSLAGKSFEDIQKLFNEGKLTGKAKELFELLQKIKAEGGDIDTLLADNAQSFKEALTGTTSDSIVQSIVDGFAQGKRSAADFADDFQSLMRRALLQSLQMKYLEGPLTDFFNEFAALSESDGQLTAGEVSNLQSVFNGIIQNANDQFQQIQSIAGLNLSSQSGGNNTLSGAIRGITEQQAELLAGQFGGLRITALEQLNIARQSLAAHNQIIANTASTVNRMERMLTKFDSYETGQRKLHVQV